MIDNVQTTGNGISYNSRAFRADLRATKAFNWEEAAAVIVARSREFQERCAYAVLGYTSAAQPA